jgi:hypothetical protein
MIVHLLLSNLPGLILLKNTDNQVPAFYEETDRLTL